MTAIVRDPYEDSGQPTPLTPAEQAVECRCRWWFIVAATALVAGPAGWFLHRMVA